MKTPLNLKQLPAFLTHPAGCLIVTVLLSAFFWALPDFSIFRKGFEQREPILDYGLLILIAWYSLIVGSCSLGFYLGKTVRWPFPFQVKNVRLDDAFSYLCFSIIASISCFYVLYVLNERLGFPALVEALLTGRGNSLKDALYEDYSIGLLSLRYIVILTGALALFRILSGISRGFFDFYNILLLLFVASISSRLSLIAASLSAFCLLCFHGKKVRTLPLLVAAFSVVILLFVFNSSRNMNYYAQRGNYGFFESGISEIMAYLGAPFQASLAIGNNPLVLTGKQDPSFASNIEPNLTTNSALADLVGRFGIAVTFFGMFVFASATGLLMGILHQLKNTCFALAYCILLYGYAEIWRIFLFDKGIFIILFTASLLLPSIAIIIKSLLLTKH